MAFIPLLNSFIQLLNVVIFIVVALALLFFLWGLAIFVMQAGNAEKRSEGRQKMLWGIIAFTVMLGVWGFVKILLLAFGIGEGEGQIIIPPLFPPYI